MTTNLSALPLAQLLQASRVCSAQAGELINSVTTRELLKINGALTQRLIHAHTIIDQMAGELDALDPTERTKPHGA